MVVRHFFLLDPSFSWQWRLFLLDPDFFGPSGASVSVGFHFGWVFVSLSCSLYFLYGISGDWWCYLGGRLYRYHAASTFCLTKVVVVVSRSGRFLRDL